MADDQDAERGSGERVPIVLFYLRWEICLVESQRPRVLIFRVISRGLGEFESRI
jgi:hypothetical protein